MGENKTNKETPDAGDSNNTLHPPHELNLTGDVCVNYCEFEENFRNYMKATGFMDLDEHRKINILLKVIGDDTNKIIISNKLYGETLQEVLTNLKTYFDRKNSTIMYRYKMFLAVQEENETIEQYVTRLKILAKPCEFGTEEENQIRDRLVFGLRNKKWRDRLFKELEFSLNEAVIWCCTWEMCERQELETKKTKNEDDQVDIYKLKSKTMESEKSKIVSNGDESNLSKIKFICNKCGHLHGLKDCPAFGEICFVCKKLNHFGNYCKYKTFHLITKNFNCARCGQLHEFRECPAFGKTCQNCNKLNHFASECKIRKAVNEVQVGYKQTFSNRNEPFNEVTKDLIKNNWSVNLKIEKNDSCKFKLDTRSGVNIIPFSLYKKFKCFDDVEINKPELKFSSFSNNGIKIIGYVDLNCATGTNDNYQVIRFCLLNHAECCTLGLPACINLNLLRRVELSNSWNQFWNRNFQKTGEL